MPILYVHFKGAKEATRIPVGKVEDDGKTITVKAEDGSVVGSIDKGEIAGWWVQPDYKPAF